MCFYSVKTIITKVFGRVIIELFKKHLVFKISYSFLKVNLKLHRKKKILTARRKIFPLMSLENDVLPKADMTRREHKLGNLGTSKGFVKVEYTVFLFCRFLR